MNFSTHFSQLYSVNWKQRTIMWCFFLVVGIAQAQTNLPLNTTWETSSLTTEDLIIPTNTTSLSIAIKGGDGGRVQFNGGLCNDKKILGGEGAAISATFTVGDESDMLQAGGRLRVFTGQAGGVDQHGCIEGGNYSGGGGGSTAVLYLPPGSTPTSSTLWRLLAVAGGGGGANRPTAGTTYKGKGANSEDSGDSVQSNIAKGGKNMGIGSAGTCPDYTDGIELGYCGGSGNCSDDGRTQNGRNMISSYSDEADQDGKILSLRVGLEDLSIASGTGGTDGKADGGDGFTGGAAGAGGGGGGGGSSGGAGGLRTPGGGGGSWLTQGFEITESSKSSGSDGGGSGNNGYVQLTASLVPKAICKTELTINLDGSGSGQVSASEVDNGSIYPTGWKLQLFDNTSSSIWSNPKIFTCSDAGKDYSVQMQLLDDTGSFQGQCSSTIKVRDAAAPQAWCVNPTIQLNNNGQATLTTSMVNSGSSDNCGGNNLSFQLSQTNFTCNDAGQTREVTLTASDAAGNSGTCKSYVKVEDNIAPVARCHANNIVLDAQNTDHEYNVVRVSGVEWQSFTVQQTGLLSSVDLKLASQDPPFVTFLYQLYIYDGEGTAGERLSHTTLQIGGLEENVSWVNLELEEAISVESGRKYTIVIQPITGSLYWATDHNNPYSEGRNSNAPSHDYAFRTYINIVAAISAPLDANGRSSITINQIDNGSSDNCGIASRTLSQSSFDCSEVGEQTVTLTVTDNNGNSSSCNTILNVQDKTAPIALCQSTSSLDAQNTSTANQNSLGSLRWQSFTAKRTSTLTQIEILGRSNFTPMNTTLTIKVYPGEGTGGTPLFTTSKQMTISPTTSWIKLFSNEDIPVQSGNRYTVSVQAAGGLIFWRSSGFSNPYSAGRNNINSLSDFGFRTYTIGATPVQLDAAGMLNLTLDQIDNGSSDACGIASRTLSQSSFDCSEVGEQTVTLTVTDNNGNSSSCNTVLNVQDKTAPVALCQNTATLDAQNPAASNLSSLGSLRWQSFTAQRTSALTQIEILGRSNFTPMNTTLTIKVYSGEGTGGTLLFSTSKQMTISPTTSWIKLFSDADIPVQSGNRYTVSVQAAGGLIFWRASGFSNPYSAGRNNINSLSDFGFRTYTIGATPVQLNAAGVLNITLDQIDNGSTDACGIASRTLSQSSFDCAEVGEQTVTLTVTDNNGNSSSCNTILNVQDKTAPVALCQSPATLDAQNPAASNLSSLGSLRWQSFTAQRTSALTQIEILGKSNFTPMNTTLTIKVYSGEGTGGTLLFTTSKQMTISPTTSWIRLFTDEDIPVQSGNRYTVSVQAAGGLIFWRASGFSNPYSAGRNNINSLSDFGFRTYTSVLPEVVLDNAGLGSITIDDVNAGSNDACGIASQDLSQTSFDCTEVGEQTVSLTVTDHSGNASTCEMKILIVDKTAPVTICQSTSIELDADGNASITPADIDNGSSDACGIAERSLDITDFNCQDLGENTVVLTVKDINNNQSQCTATVEVLDVTAPDVLADLIFVSGEPSSADFEVDVAIDDVCDIDPTLVSVMEIPEVDGLDVSYKVKNKKKIKISLEDNTVKVEAPNPVDFWEAIVAQGGISVEDQQIIKLNRETAQEYLYQFDGDDLSKIIGPSFSLLARGTDASGNTSIATAVPVFPGDSPQSALTQSANDSGEYTSSIPASQHKQGQLGSLRSYPNPFSNFTNIEFRLSNSAKTSLQIFNLQGQRVFDWQFGRLEAGEYKEQWQGISSSGDQLPAGLYLIQLQTGEDVIIKKVTLQR